MAFRRSMGLRNQMLNGAKAFDQLMNGGHIAIYSGAQPASPEYPETGVLLANLGTQAGTGFHFGTAASGKTDKNHGTWDGTCTVAGVAGWFRFYSTDGFTGTDGDGTCVRFDGAIGSVTGEMIMTPTNLALNAPIIIDSLEISLDMTAS